MRLLIIQYNLQSVSHYKNGDTTVWIIDPSELENESFKACRPDLVIVSKNLETEDQTRALRFAYQVTEYKNNNLQKVVLL